MFSIIWFIIEHVINQPPVYNLSKKIPDYNLCQEYIAIETVHLIAWRSDLKPLPSMIPQVKTSTRTVLIFEYCSHLCCILLLHAAGAEKPIIQCSDLCCAYCVLLAMCVRIVSRESPLRVLCILPQHQITFLPKTKTPSYDSKYICVIDPL